MFHVSHDREITCGFWVKEEPKEVQRTTDTQSDYALLQDGSKVKFLSSMWRLTANLKHQVLSENYKQSTALTCCIPDTSCSKWNQSAQHDSGRINLCYVIPPLTWQQTSLHWFLKPCTQNKPLRWSSALILVHARSHFSTLHMLVTHSLQFSSL